MASTSGDTYRYQRYLSKSIHAERAALGWSIHELADRSGIDYQTLLRKLNLKRPFALLELEQVAHALNLSVSELMEAAEARMAKNDPSDDEPPADDEPLSGGDPRSVILWLLAHPEDDDELNTRLSDVEQQTGVSARRLARLGETIRQVRREELTNALDALPPSPPQKAPRPESRINQDK